MRYFKSISIFRTILLLVFVIDRFCCVFLTYSYPKCRVKVATVLNIAAYIITAMICSVPIGLDCYSFSATSWNCRNTAGCNVFCAGYQQFLGFAVYIPCSVVSVALYAALFHKGCKARRSLPVAANDLTTDQNRVKRELRTTITFFLMFLSAFMFNIPPGLAFLAINLAGISTNSGQSLWFYFAQGTSVNLFTVTRLADPIFILRNKDVREVFSKTNWIPKLGNRF